MLKVQLTDGTTIGFSFIHDQVGKYTVCRLFKGDDKLSSGYAYCNPRDHYTKRIGRKISLRNALIDARLPYLERQHIWQQLLTKQPQTFI